MIGLSADHNGSIYKFRTISSTTPSAICTRKFGCAKIDCHYQEIVTLFRPNSFIMKVGPEVSVKLSPATLNSAMEFKKPQDASQVAVSRNLQSNSLN